MRREGGGTVDLPALNFHLTPGFLRTYAFRSQLGAKEGGSRAKHSSFGDSRRAGQLSVASVSAIKGVVRLPASTAVQRVIVAHIRTNAGICKRRGTRLADGGRQAASF